MLLRVLQFLVGAALSGGGGYLAWTHRSGAVSLFPPGPDGPPLLLLLGILGVTTGIVFLVSAVHPRPNQKRAAADKSTREDAALADAEAYYSERSRAADRDWRSAPINPPPAPAPAPAPPPPVQPAPVAAVPWPAPVKPEAITPPPLASVPGPPGWPTPPPVTQPPPKQVMQPAAAVVPPPAPQPPAPTTVATTTAAPPPPPANPFPSAVTLAPIPRPPAPTLSAPPAPAPAPAPAPVPVPASEGPHPAIRSAISGGQLNEAEQMLNDARETATGLDLAHLTALAGDHAAAAGQQSHAKWLWRLAMKRFGENDAVGSPDAQRIAALLPPPR